MSIRRKDLSTSGEILLKGRLDTLGLLAGARSRRTAATGTGIARDGLVLGDRTLTGALTSGTRAYGWNVSINVSIF